MIAANAPPPGRFGHVGGQHSPLTMGALENGAVARATGPVLFQPPIALASGFVIAGRGEEMGKASHGVLFMTHQTHAFQVF